MARINILSTCLAGAAALALSACAESNDTLSSTFASVKFWRITKTAEESYPHLPPVEARKQFVRDKYREAVAPLQTDEERQALAASIYMGFSMLNGRAIPAYCGEMNVDASAFEKGFRRQNRRLESALGRVLEAHGVTIEEAWARQERFAMAAAKAELMNAGGHIGSHSVCTKLKEQPHLFLTKAHFTQEFPEIAQTLRAAP
ncbi:MAG: hypothetical protein AAFW68_08375 [Pseudomonadota bacterium]